MRVAHVVTNSRTADMLGFEKYALDLAIAQKASGSDVMIMTNRQSALSAACRQHGISAVVEGSLDQPRADESMPALVSQFSGFGADVIHVHTPSAMARAVPAGNQLGIPCVYTIHIIGKRDDGTFEARNPVTTAINAGMRFTTVCVSRVTFENMKKHGVPEAELHYVPLGTKPAPREHAAEAPSFSRPNLIFVGSLDPWKGPDLAILAMAELRRRRGPDCPTLDIYGNGDLEGHLKEMVAVLQLDDIVRFRGFQANILDRCPASDILLMSSRSELGPLVVLEAMSRGMPIVASEVGNVPEMLPDQRYGRVVPAGSIIPLADAVESLLADTAAGRFDPGPVIERHHSLFTLQKMAERVGAVYNQALAAHSGSR